jgi:hypothetical protein
MRYSLLSQRGISNIVGGFNRRKSGMPQRVNRLPMICVIIMIFCNQYLFSEFIGDTVGVVNFS